MEPNTPAPVASNPTIVKNNGLGKALIVLGLVGGGFFFFNRYQKNKDAQDEASKLQDDIYTQQASVLKNAMDGAGTNEKALFDLAPYIKDWPKVVAAFARLTKGENLEQRLNEELSAAEYAKFMSLLQYKGRTKTNTGNSSSQVFNEPVAQVNDFPIGAKVYLNWKTASGSLKVSINAYTDYNRYPNGPIVIKRPTNTTPVNFGTVLGYRKISYGSSNVSIILIQVKLSNGQALWLRAVDLGKFFVATKKPIKRTVKGIGDLISVA